MLIYSSLVVMPYNPLGENMSSLPHPTLVYILVLFSLAVITFKDIKNGIIPDGWLLVLLALGIIQCGLSHILSALILGGIGYGLYKAYLLLKGREGLGLGDVKMMIVSGVWLPIETTPLFLCIAGGSGIITALLYKSRRFPFGPALAFALGICIFGKAAFSQGDRTMTYSFSGPVLTPRIAPTSLVIIMHGYGASGEDLISLGEVWHKLLPSTVFVAPNAPFICDSYPEGGQWFRLHEWDFPPMLKEIEGFTPSFNDYIDGLIKTYKIPVEKVAFVGFSQGAMMAIHMALARPECAGAVAYSGGFMGTPKDLPSKMPPILLIHGLDDQRVPASFSQDAEKKLASLGIPVTLSLLPRLDHSINEHGLHLGGNFLKEILK